MPEMGHSSASTLLKIPELDTHHFTSTVALILYGLEYFCSVV